LLEKKASGASLRPRLIHAGGSPKAILFLFIIIFIPSPRLSLLHGEERAMGGGDEDEDEEKEDGSLSTRSVNQP
jgi:hypothetical protein